MSHPGHVTVTNPQPASHKRRASSICLPSATGENCCAYSFRFFDFVRRRHHSRVVPLDQTRILLLEIEGIGSAAEEYFHRLLLKAVRGLEAFRRVRMTAQDIQLGQDPTPVIPSIVTDMQPHVLDQLPAGAGIKRTIRDRQRTVLRHAFGVVVEFFELSPHGSRGDQDVSRESHLRVGQPGDARVQRTHHGPGWVTASHHVHGRRPMIGDAVSIRADDGHLVGESCQLRESTAKRYTGKRCLNLARDAANRGRGFHVRIKCLELRRATLQIQHDDGAILHDAAVPSGFRGEQLRQRKSADRGRPDLQEFAARPTHRVGTNPKHRLAS